MVNTIIIKNDSNTGNSPANNEIVTGELAINTTDGKLFYGDASGNAQEFTASVSGDTFATDLKIGRDSTDHIFFNNDNRIGFRVANANQVEFKDGQILPVTDDDIDLGSSDYKFKDLYIDGIAYIDQARIGTLGDSINISNNTMTNVDINSGTIDGSTVGANSASTGAFTTLSASGDMTVGDDLLLNSDSAVLSFGADADTSLTHTDGTGLTLNSTNKLCFNASTNFIHYSGEANSKDVLQITSEGDINVESGDDIAFDITDTGSSFRIKDDGTVFFRVIPSDGHVDLDADGAEIHFGANEEIQLVHVHDTGLKLTETGGGTPTLQFVDANESVSSDGSKLILTSNGVAFSMPTADGSNGHFLKTNGSGTLSFAAASSGGIALSDLSVGSEGSASGDGAIAYNNSSGVFTYTPPVHDSLSGFVSNEHIDHSGVSITAGAGLSGGGTIASTRSLAIDISEFSAVTPANGDSFLTLDSDGSTEQLTTTTALATLLAGSGLSASNSVLSVDTLNQNTTGSAATLTTARNIGGVSFDGSANINLPGVNTSGNQDTSGNAATATALTSGNKTIAGVLDITDTTDASDDSGDTGALRVEGGASIAKKLFVGTDLDVDGTTNLDVVDIDGAVDMATTLTLGGNADFNGDLDVDGTTNLDAVDIDGAVAAGDHITMATDKKIIFRATDIFMHSNAANDLKITTPADLLISANGIITYDSDQHDYGESTSSDVVFNFNTSGNDGRLTWDQSADTFVFDKAVDALSFKINGTAISATAAELNIMDGVTASTSELNIMDGVTATTSELNALDGITATVGELNLLDGGTSVGSSITIADTDGFIVNDAVTMKLIPASDVSTYAGGGASTGNYSFSSNTMSNSNAMTIDCGNDINLDAGGADIVFKDDGATYGSATNNSGGLIIKSGTTSVMRYDSAGSPEIGNDGIKQIGAWIFGHSNLDNGSTTYISWSSTNSNQSNIFNHRALMPAKGRIVEWIMKTDGGLSGNPGTPPLVIQLTGSTTSGQSDATHSDDSYRFTGAVSSAEQLTGLIGYEWEKGDTIVGTITPTAGSDQRAQSSALIEWTY